MVVSLMASRWEYPPSVKFRPRLADVLAVALPLLDLLPSEVADLLDVSNRTVHRWQTGRRRASWRCAVPLAAILVNELARERGWSVPFTWEGGLMKARRLRKVEAVRERLREGVHEDGWPMVGLSTAYHPSIFSEVENIEGLA